MALKFLIEITLKFTINACQYTFCSTIFLKTIHYEITVDQKHS